MLALAGAQEHFLLDTRFHLLGKLPILLVIHLLGNVELVEDALEGLHCLAGLAVIVSVVFGKRPRNGSVEAIDRGGGQHFRRTGLPRAETTQACGNKKRTSESCCLGISVPFRQKMTRFTRA